MGGRLSIADSSWVNCSAKILSSGNINWAGYWSTVKFGNDGVNSCILIGNPATHWNYPYIVVDTVQVHKNGITSLSADWTMEIITSEEGITVQQAVTPQTYIIGRVGIGTVPSSSYVLDM